MTTSGVKTHMRSVHDAQKEFKCDKGSKIKVFKMFIYVKV